MNSGTRFALGVLLSVLSGLMLLLACPPYGIWWLAWFAFFPAYLGVLIAIIAYFKYRERTFIERTRYRWLIPQGVVGWLGFEMVRATFIPVVATSAFIGYTQATQAWLIQPVSIFRIYGLNLVIMLANYTLTQGVIAWCDRGHRLPIEASPDSRTTRAWWVAPGVVVAAWIGVSLLILSAQGPSDHPRGRVAGELSAAGSPRRGQYVTAAV